MTQHPRDQFAKRLLKELLLQSGSPEVSREVPGEPLFVDVYFVPNPHSPPAPELGLLGQLTQPTPCLLEPYSSPPTSSEIRSCILKLFWCCAEEQRQANRTENTAEARVLPKLWIFTPSVSDATLNRFGFTHSSEYGVTGIYLLPEGQRSGLVALNELPEIPETLWLRLMGRGKTQTQAIQEIIGLPAGSPWRTDILEWLANWRITLEVTRTVSPDEQELIMNLSPVYEKWRQETLESGLQQGKREVAMNLMSMGLSVEQIAQATGLSAEQVLQLQSNGHSTAN